MIFFLSPEKVPWPETRGSWGFMMGSVRDVGMRHVQHGYDAKHWDRAGWFVCTLHSAQVWHCIGVQQSPASPFKFVPSLVQPHGRISVQLNLLDLPWSDWWLCPEISTSKISFFFFFPLPPPPPTPFFSFFFGQSAAFIVHTAMCHIMSITSELRNFCLVSWSAVVELKPYCKKWKSGYYLLRLLFLCTSPLHAFLLVSVSVNLNYFYADIIVYIYINILKERKKKIEWVISNDF